MQMRYAADEENYETNGFYLFILNTDKIQILNYTVAERK